jgi:hypothetical protein
VHVIQVDFAALNFDVIEFAFIGKLDEVSSGQLDGA